MVFPLPGGPETTTELFFLRPGDIMESNPGMPVFTTDDSFLFFCRLCYRFHLPHNT